MTARGHFIAFEGGEGVGKSTQVRRLADNLAERGISHVVSREPGGTPGAEAIRELLLHGAVDRWLPMSEALLVLAARHDHVARKIAPALAAGSWVLCDRFVDSTKVYQGLAGGLGVELVARLHELTIPDLVPDLTIVLDLPVDQGLARRAAGGDQNRYEEQPPDFHQQVRAGLLALANAAPTRYAVITADAPPQAVALQVLQAVERRCGRLPPPARDHADDLYRAVR